jgi:NAD-dependent protein deacetylase/lipoamidase
VVTVGAAEWTGLAALVADSRRTLLFTGAGISTGSGIADFRGPGGVWTRRRPVTLQEFLQSKDARVEYWDQKLEAWPSFRAARPNPVHVAAVSLERAGRLHMVVTQNIDGLHRRAGTSSDRLVEIHGTNLWVECLGCGERTDPDSHMLRFESTREPPVCRCGGWLKAATISFGQSLRSDDLERAFRAAASADLVVALGSTLSVYPAASIPLEAAENGAPYVIVNRGQTDHDGHRAVTLRIEGDVVDVFPKAVTRALGGTSA